MLGQNQGSLEDEVAETRGETNIFDATQLSAGFA